MSRKKKIWRWKTNVCHTIVTPEPPGDTVAPTLSITLSQYTFKIGETATVTFTFSEEVLNFTVADVTSPSGSLSSFTVTGNPLIYTATFTPTNGIADATNVITVGTGWTDLNGNAPASSTTSSNYTMDTSAPTTTITSTETSPTSAATIPLTITFSEVVTGFVVEDITVDIGTLSGFAGSGAVYTVNWTPPYPAAMTMDISAGVAVDAAGNGNTAATQFSITSTASYTFNPAALGNGALPAPWSAATWTIASGKVINTPGLGAEKLADTGLEANYTDGLCDSFAAKTGTPTVAESADVHGGSKSQSFISTAVNQNIRMLASPSAWTLGEWARASVWVKRTAGTNNGAAIDLRSTNWISYFKEIRIGNTWTQFVMTARVTAVNSMSFYTPYQLTGSGDTIIVDDESMKVIVTANLFNVIDAGRADVTVAASMTLATASTVQEKTGLQNGIVVNLDSASNPQNFVIAYADGTSGSGNYLIKMDKCVGGVYTSVIANQYVTYAAGASIQIVKSGTTYSLSYNGIAVGTPQTISDAGIINNTRHGYFATDPTHLFGTITIS